MDTTWTNERRELFRKLWGEGYTAPEIAKKMGGFGHCSDGGRAAICSQARKMRNAAKAVGNKTEVAFWSRGKGSANAETAKRHPGGSGLRGSYFNRPIPREKVSSFLDSVPAQPVRRPTEDEVYAEWTRQVCAAADAIKE